MSFEEKQVRETAVPLGEKVGGDTKLQHLEAAADDDNKSIIIISLQEKRLVRRLDRRILPIACLMYLFACAHLLFKRIGL